MQARALIDPGAAMTLVSSRITQLFSLPLTKANLAFKGVQGTPCKTARHLTTFVISPLQVNQTQVTLSAAMVQKVTDNLPVQGTPTVEELPHIQNLKLADPTYHKPGRIDVLLGADAYPELMVHDCTVTGPAKTPAAQNTIFGWTIVGPVTFKGDFSAVIPTNFAQGHTVDKLDELLSHFWETEEPHSPAEALTPEEEQVQQHYTDTVKYSPSTSRYKVTLPRRTEVAALGESRTRALLRYHSNEKSILRRNIWKPFQDVVQEYLDLGHAELILSTAQAPLETYYLPMHSVTKQSSTSTKLRVVFDASAPTISGVSLNNSLLIGPTLHSTLEMILIRFMTYPVAVSADISKMYREIELTEADRDLHRYL